MRYVLVLFVIFVQGTMASAQGVTPQQAEQAMRTIRPAILNHPESLVREKLFGWLVDGSVKFAANNILPEMSVSLEKDKVLGKDQVLLWYNLTFIANGLSGVSPADKADYLKLVLYHEAVEIDEHFNGRTRLIPLVSVGPVSEESVARTIWDLEWPAVTNEWELAKKLGKRYLLPVIDATTRDGETPKNFLEGFYLLQMGSHAVEFRRGLAVALTKRYKEELAKLAARRSA